MLTALTPSLKLRHRWPRSIALALQTLAQQLSPPPDRFRRLPCPALRGLFVTPVQLHLTKKPFALHFSFQDAQSAPHIVVADLNEHKAIILPIACVERVFRRKGRSAQGVENDLADLARGEAGPPRRPRRLHRGNGALMLGLGGLGRPGRRKLDGHENPLADMGEARRPLLLCVEIRGVRRSKRPQVLGRHPVLPDIGKASNALWEKETQSGWPERQTTGPGAILICPRWEGPPAFTSED